MYEKVFQREEVKYLINEEKKNLLLEKIKGKIEQDKYYQTTICNIYFDNDNNDLIINSLEKPVFKEKIRLRSYKIPDMEDDVFLEIKNKYKGIVNKRRIKIKLKDYYKYLNKNEYKNTQIMKEIDYYIKYYHLKPKIFIAYDRLSFKGKDNPHLRITIDSNLRSRTTDLNLELGDAGKKLFKSNYYILEIKSLTAIPIWLTSTLSELQIYPTSFSKYGSIYKNLKEMIQNA